MTPGPKDAPEPRRGRSRVPGAAIVGTALLAQAVVVGLAWSNTIATRFANFVHEDAPMYYGLAELFEQRGLLYDGEDYPREHRVRVPLYSLALLALGKAAGAAGVWPAAAVTAFHAVIAAAGCWLLYRIVACLVSVRVGFLAGLVAAVAPANPVWSLAHMPEAPAQTLWLAAVLLTVRAGTTGTGLTAAGAGLVGAAAALTKPVYFYAEALTLLALALVPHRPPVRRLAILAVCHVAGFAAGVSPWYFRNYAVWQEAVFSPQAGNQFYFHLRPKLFTSIGRPVEDPSHLLTEGFSDDRVPRTQAMWKAKFGVPWDNLAKRLRAYGRLAIDDFKTEWRDFVRLWAREHPKLYFWTGAQPHSQIAGVPQKPERYAPGVRGTLHWMRDVGWLPYQLVTWAMLLGIYGLAVAGFVMMARHRSLLTLWLLLGLAYFAGVQFFITSTRYRYPMMFLLAIPAAVALDRLTACCQRKRTLAHGNPC